MTLHAALQLSLQIKASALLITEMLCGAVVKNFCHCVKLMSTYAVVLTTGVII